MLGARVDFKFFVNSRAESVVRDHPFDGAFDDALGVVLAGVAQGLDFAAADEAGVAGVNLLIVFFAGKADFFGVDHDHEIAGIDVGSENRLVLASQKARGFHGNLTQDAVGGIDDPPFAGQIFLFG